MPYAGRQTHRMGVDLPSRTATIRDLALAGVYHKDIAARLGVSVATIESTMRIIRRNEVLPSMRGPRAKVVTVDWATAREFWHDLRLTSAQVAVLARCSERTLFRKLGNRNIEPTTAQP